MNYYTEIESYIKRNEVNKRARVLEENQDILTNYWNIGRILVEAQGGTKRAKYGNGLIKEWSIQFTEKYGKGYDATNLKRFRKFYVYFPKGAPLEHLSWTNIKVLLPIKEENKRNYYINLCLTRKLSRRELEKEIKNDSYERIVNKPDKIEIVSLKKQISFLNSVQNPIIIESVKEIFTEHDLEMSLLAKLQNFFNQLGEGFTLVGNQYKVNYHNTNYFIDILLFNFKLNSFVVVELKLRELRKEDKSQIEFYMKLIDEQVKETFHNKTIGIIISKKQDQFIVNFVGCENIIPLTYEIRS